MRARAVALVALLAGCPSSEPGPPRSAVVTLAPAMDEQATRAARYTLGEVRVETIDGRARVHAALDVRWDREVTFDGLETGGRDVLIRQEDVQLVGGPEPVSMVELEVPSDVPEGYLVVSADRPRAWVGELLFGLSGPLPEHPALVLRDDTGVVTFPLKGRWRTQDGVEAVAIEPVDVAGRPLEDGGTLRWEGGEDARPRPPFLLPLGVTHATLQIEGHPAIPLDVPADATIVRPTLRSDEQVDEVASAFAASFDGLFEDRRGDDVLALAHQLGTPDAIAAWVRNHVAVLATAGQQRSPAAVLRLGAGGPVDRAALALELIHAIGQQAEIVCGDLPLATVRRLYATSVDVPPAPGPLAARIVEGRPRVAALAGTLAASLAALPERPEGTQARYRLVPEWCWLELRSPDKDVPPTTLDLRPPPFDRDPLPFPWRSSDRLASEVWSMHVAVSALTHVPTGVHDVPLVAQGGPVPSLDDRALLLDVYPGVTPGSVRGRLSWFDDAEVHSIEGEDVPVASIETLSLAVGWRDPSDLETRRTGIELWQATGGPIPTMRVLITADAGVVDVDALARHLHDAVDRRHAIPGAEALASRHDLYARLRLALAGGLVSESPSLVVTIATLEEGGTVGWRMETLPPQPPVDVAGAASVVTLARYAAADAVARAIVLGAPDPAAPVQWLRDSADLPLLPPVAPGMQIVVARSLDALVVGLDRVAPPAFATIWMLDPLTGGVSWYTGRPTATSLDVTPLHPPIAGGPRWPHDRWDLSIRCAEALRWTSWAERPYPGVCR